MSGGYNVEKKDIEDIVKKSAYFSRGGLNSPYVDQEVKIGVDANGEGVFRFNFYGQILIVIIVGLKENMCPRTQFLLKLWLFCLILCVVLGIWIL